jgi:hypothetical protein
LGLGASGKEKIELDWLSPKVCEKGEALDPRGAWAATAQAIGEESGK